MFEKMSLFLNANAAGDAGGSMWVSILMLVAIGAAMYFILIRPQRKKQKEEKKMLEATQVGDEILTIGGIYGKIVAVKEESYILESGPDRAKIRVAKWAMQQNFTEHTDANASANKKADKPIEK